MYIKTKLDPQITPLEALFLIDPRKIIKAVKSLIFSTYYPSTNINIYLQ